MRIKITPNDSTANMSLRLRAGLSKCSKGKSNHKGETPKWLEQIFGKSEKAAVETSEVEEQSSDIKAAVTVGFSNEIGKAFRCTLSKKGKVLKTVYAEIFAPEDTADHSPVHARFPGDEEPTVITDVTVGDLKLRKDSLWQATKGALFCGIMKDGQSLKLLKSVRSPPQLGHNFRFLCRHTLRKKRFWCETSRRGRYGPETTDSRKHFRERIQWTTSWTTKPQQILTQLWTSFCLSELG